MIRAEFKLTMEMIIGLLQGKQMEYRTDNHDIVIHSPVQGIVLDYKDYDEMRRNLQSEAILHWMTGIQDKNTLELILHKEYDTEELKSLKPKEKKILARYEKIIEDLRLEITRLRNKLEDSN